MWFLGHGMSHKSALMKDLEAAGARKFRKPSRAGAAAGKIDKTVRKGP
jgi:hypothetical protein